MVFISATDATSPHSPPSDQPKRNHRSAWLSAFYVRADHEPGGSGPQAAGGGCIEGKSEGETELVAKSLHEKPCTSLEPTTDYSFSNRLDGTGRATSDRSPVGPTTKDLEGSHEQRTKDEVCRKALGCAVDGGVTRADNTKDIWRRPIAKHEMPGGDSVSSHYSNGLSVLPSRHSRQKCTASSLSERGLGIAFEHDKGGGNTPPPASIESKSPLDGHPSMDKGQLKLSQSQIQELTESPQSIPYRALPSEPIQWQRRAVSDSTGVPPPAFTLVDTTARLQESNFPLGGFSEAQENFSMQQGTTLTVSMSTRGRPHSSILFPTRELSQQPLSTSADQLSQSSLLRSKLSRSSSGRSETTAKKHIGLSSQATGQPLPSPLPTPVPVPPLSLPTYLQLELASGRPSPLYIHHSAVTDFPYESSRVKLERLTNFLVLPPALEQVLWFGTLACLDAWLHSFTILPLRFFKAIYILLESWAVNLSAEIRFISGFVIKGVGRVWRRRAISSVDLLERRGIKSDAQIQVIGGTKKREADPVERNEKKVNLRRRGRPDMRRLLHRRQKSIPSTLTPDDKADILKGLLMIATCLVLMRFDASKMYHWIRGQAAIKLYVIYNVLEVSDRLLAAIGQDVLECLFSREALERKPDGRSKVFRPFWLFLLALAYTIIHSAALFYQVMTLNVAVNSYSNALITLLLSNQFVEIKSTVFKKFEKENLFQLTCADVVERFQLWLMLTIIASRNIVETGSFSFLGVLGSSFGNSTTTSSSPLSTPPRTSTSIIPQAFAIFPSTLVSSLSRVNAFLPAFAQVLGPFLVVLGSEMLVDWLKHAYINKFNNTRPAIYGLFLDILAKDYYINAFGDQNLTRRLGLPIIPLSCIFIRVSVQTYMVFISAILPQHVPTAVSDSTSLSSIHSQYSPYPIETPSLTLRSLIPSSATHVRSLLRTAFANTMPSAAQSVYIFTAIFVLTGFIVLLVLKLLLGMLLLTLARSRYKAMKAKESGRTSTNSSSDPSHQAVERSRACEKYFVGGSRRVGGWGVVEVNDDKRRWIYADDPEGLNKLRAKEEKEKGGHNNNNNNNNDSRKPDELSLDHVQRYEMAAKRIW